MKIGTLSLWGTYAIHRLSDSVSRVRVCVTSGMPCFFLALEFEHFSYLKYIFMKKRLRRHTKASGGQNIFLSFICQVFYSTGNSVRTPSSQRAPSLWLCCLVGYKVYECICRTTNISNPFSAINSLSTFFYKCLFPDSLGMMASLYHGLWYICFAY